MNIQSMIPINIKPIRIIHTPFAKPEETPSQAARSNAIGSIEVFIEYLILKKYPFVSFYTNPINFQPRDLLVNPFLDDKYHGVFSTRFYSRPNRNGLSVVRLLKSIGNNLVISGVEMLDGSQLIDIKPYVEEFDRFEVDKTGLYGKRAFK